MVFPIHDVAGRVVAFGGRLLAEGEPKYLNSPETPLYHKSNVLYGLNRSKDAIRREGVGIIVEGYFDLITAVQAGVSNVVATSGTALTDGHAALMRRFAERWVVVFDGDAAGIRAAKRSLEVFVTNGLFARGVLLPDGADPDSFIRAQGADGLPRAGREGRGPHGFLPAPHGPGAPARHDRGEGGGRARDGAAAREGPRARGAGGLRRTGGPEPRRQGGGPLVGSARPRGQGRRRPGASAAATAPRAAAAERPRAEEVELVKALLAHPALAAELRGRIALEELESEDCRAVAGTAFALLDRGGPDGLAGRLQFEDERLRRLVTAWAADPGPLAEEHEARRAAADCLVRIRRRRVERESRLIQEKIRSAEAAGEHETVKKLLADKHGLHARPAETA